VRDQTDDASGSAEQVGGGESDARVQVVRERIVEEDHVRPLA
jgi:hypothetical protein